MKRIRNPFKGRASALGQRLTGRIRNRLVTDTLREVHHTFPRFLSLLVLSALAVCFLAGLRATAPDMKLSADAYFDQQNLMDLHIASTLGLTQEDVDAIAEEEGVASVQGAYTIDALVPMDNQEMVVKVLSYSGEGDVNQPALVEGRLPEGEDECLVEPLFLELSGLSIGDTISLDTGEGDYADALSVEEVTIVGTANSPLYIALDRGSSTLGTGSVDAFLILPVESFTMDYYTDAYLLAEGASELETYSDEYEELVDQLAQQLNQGEIEYRAGVRQLESSQRQLEASREELDQGWEDYETGLQQWEDGEKAYQEGYESYTQSRQEAEDQLKDGRKEVEQAKRDLTLLEDGEWYILDRNTNTGYVSYSMDADRIANLAAVFPLIFFLVAALVSLTTMTRMVEEQRTTIGGLKAMGFSRGSIAIKYVGYGFLSSVIGAVLGLAVGLTLLPWIICTAWSAMYTIGDIHYSFEAATSLLAAGAAVGTVTLAALLACFSTLAATPAQLMRPKAPPVGKRIFLERITPLWRKLSFHYKITLRNLFRYQKRFWMTVAGIGGCAALIVTAFGVRGSIMGVMEEQFDVLYHYSAQVGLVDEITPLELEEVEDTLSESGLVDDSLACRVETVTAQSESYTLDCYLQTTPSQEELSRFVELRHRTDDVPVTLPDDGAVITEKMASLLGVEVGDTITLDGESRVTITVADITEHYVQHYIYVSDTYYGTLFGEAPTANTVLVDFPVEESGAGELESQLVSLDGVSSLTLLSDTADTFSSSMESVDYAVILIIFCAAALAFVVLMNLTNINITERLRELATLKVLGFYNREVSAYIYRENAILTVFGVLAGMVLGKFLHQWLILTVEVDMVMFDRVLDLSSYLWAAVLTVVFSLAVNLTARRKLRDLDMVEALKSVE